MTCCEEGFKLLMDVIFCEAPCCPGLREFVTDDAPHLGLVIACQAPHHVRIAYLPRQNDKKAVVNTFPRTSGASTLGAGAGGGTGPPVVARPQI